MVWICSAEPRGLCGDPRIFDDRTKVPQVLATPAAALRYSKTHRDLSHASHITASVNFASAPYHRIEDPASARISSPRRHGSDAPGRFRPAHHGGAGLLVPGDAARE